mmetsp:Transcript_17281/g.42552  ORF Transcript_17281/g.42552 Transcript_17281/m.42552 type:complete len:215 (-) Transcript_17281:1695-2339(-)
MEGVVAHGGGLVHALAAGDDALVADGQLLARQRRARGERHVLHARALAELQFALGPELALGVEVLVARAGHLLGRRALVVLLVEAAALAAPPLHGVVAAQHAGAGGPGRLGHPQLVVRGGVALREHERGVCAARAHLQVLEVDGIHHAVRVAVQRAAVGAVDDEHAARRVGVHADVVHGQRARQLDGALPAQALVAAEQHLIRGAQGRHLGRHD